MGVESGAQEKCRIPGARGGRARWSGAGSDTAAGLADVLESRPIKERPE